MANSSAVLLDAMLPKRCATAIRSPERTGMAVYEKRLKNCSCLAYKRSDKFLNSYLKELFFF